MPSKKSSKIKRKTSSQSSKFHKPFSYSSKPKTSKPDIFVKKSTYSKSARLSVLSRAEARQRLIEMGGENTIDIIREFDKDMSDEELARKTGIKASDVRVVLNRLHNHGLFSYTRVRDRDSGWYSYIWKMSEGRLREFSGEDGLVYSSGEPEAVEGEDYMRKNSLGAQADQDERRSGIGQNPAELFERRKR